MVMILTNNDEPKVIILYSKPQFQWLFGCGENENKAFLKGFHYYIRARATKINITRLSLWLFAVCFPFPHINA